MDNIDIAPGRYRRPEASVHRHQYPAARTLAVGLGGLFALYLVGRGVAEFFIIHYSDAASYRNASGGPSLAGVFAVHSGPAVAIIVAAGIYLRHRYTARFR